MLALKFIFGKLLFFGSYRIVEKYEQKITYTQSLKLITFPDCGISVQRGSGENCEAFQLHGLSKRRQVHCGGAILQKSVKKYKDKPNIVSYLEDKIAPSSKGV